MSENPLITLVTIAVATALIVLFEKRKRARQEARAERPQPAVDSGGASQRRPRSFPSVPGGDQSG